MDTEITVNLIASLHATTVDLSGVANGLAGFSTDDEIEQQAKILDRIAEDASEGAAILRALIARRQRVHGLLPGGRPVCTWSPPVEQRDRRPGTD